jgi:hypothetical protein
MNSPIMPTSQWPFPMEIKSTDVVNEVIPLMPLGLQEAAV